jgi:hypothetical protein
MSCHSVSAAQHSTAQHASETKRRLVTYNAVFLSVALVDGCPSHWTDSGDRAIGACLLTPAGLLGRSERPVHE